MAKMLTQKQRRQLELYRESMKRQGISAYKPEDLFGSKQPKPQAKEKICSDCGSKTAWHSSDFGETWQCEEHKRRKG